MSRQPPRPRPRGVRQRWGQTGRRKQGVWEGHQESRAERWTRSWSASRATMVARDIQHQDSAASTLRSSRRQDRKGTTIHYPYDKLWASIAKQAETFPFFPFCFMQLRNLCKSLVTLQWGCGQYSLRQGGCRNHLNQRSYATMVVIIHWLPTENLYDNTRILHFLHVNARNKILNSLVDTDFDFCIMSKQAVCLILLPKQSFLSLKLGWRAGSGRAAGFLLRDSLNNNKIICVSSTSYFSWNVTNSVQNSNNGVQQTRTTSIFTNSDVSSFWLLYMNFSITVHWLQKQAFIRLIKALHHLLHANNNAILIHLNGCSLVLVGTASLHNLKLFSTNQTREKL